MSGVMDRVYLGQRPQANQMGGARRRQCGGGGRRKKKPKRRGGQKRKRLKTGKVGNKRK